MRPGRQDGTSPPTIAAELAQWLRYCSPGIRALKNECGTIPPASPHCALACCAHTYDPAARASAASRPRPGARSPNHTPQRPVAGPKAVRLCRSRPKCHAGHTAPVRLV